MRAIRKIRRGSVLVIVMITLLFATAALLLFMEKASVDLLVEQREAVARRLRVEAYSALEVTLAVLNEFRTAGNGLRNPAEGWSDPLAFAGYQPGDDRTVEVVFDDESGKLSLPHTNAIVLTNLFRGWGVSESDAEAVADALLGWMKHGHVYTSALRPRYDSASPAFDPPGRPLRSFAELAAIERVRELLYDPDGRPNDLWKRFVAAVSLLDFRQPNINGAKPDTLAALGQFDPSQQQRLDEYFRGAGAYQGRGPQFVQNPNEVQRIAGPAGDSSGFATTISALRVTVTVRDGRTEFRLSAVVAPPGGATTVHKTATPAVVRPSAAKSSAQQQSAPNAAQAAGTAKNAGTAASLRYPFTLLEIRENDEIPPPPPPPAGP
ncbi:MAG: general secretion pathway protein GspK [Opitutaceae bacterium]|nr:general secretion pathway protein GspK [Opitutaceae bacterium]